MKSTKLDNSLHNQKGSEPKNRAYATLLNKHLVSPTCVDFKMIVLKYLLCCSAQGSESNAVIR